MQKQQPEPDADVVVRYGLEDGEDALNTGNRIAQVSLHSDVWVSVC